MSFKPTTREEESLLMFFETCFVDHGGLLSPLHMNESDEDIAKVWDEIGYIKYERVCSTDLRRTGSDKTMVVWLSPEAHQHAHEARVARAARCFKSRSSRTISEFKAEED